MIDSAVRLVTEESLSLNGLRETEVAKPRVRTLTPHTQFFGSLSCRRESFDPRVDSIVRVEARRLREEYYVTDGHDGEIRILLRKGSYIPTFEHRCAGAMERVLFAASRAEVCGVGAQVGIA